MTERSFSHAVASGFIFVLGLYAFVHFTFFLFHPTNGFAKTLSHILLVPAVITQGKFVFYPCVADVTTGLRDYYPDDSRRELFSRALSRCVYNANVKGIADDLRVEITDADAMTGADFSPFYEKYIWQPLLLAQKTEEAVLADPEYQEELKARLTDLKTRIEDGMPFADAAGRYSEDVSGGVGGELGVFYLDSVPSWLAPAARLDRGEVSEVLDGPDAYWIATVTERGGDGDQAWVRISGIAAKKITLRRVLEERAKANPPWVFVW